MRLISGEITTQSWCHETECTICMAVFEIDAHDVKETRILRTLITECPVCKNRVDLGDISMPRKVRNFCAENTPEDYKY